MTPEQYQIAILTYTAWVTFGAGLGVGLLIGLIAGAKYIRKLLSIGGE